MTTTDPDAPPDPSTALTELIAGMMTMVEMLGPIAEAMGQYRKQLTDQGIGDQAADLCVTQLHDGLLRKAFAS